MKKLLTILIVVVSAFTVFGQSGIPLGSNFNLSSGIPLDGRLVKADTAARNAIPAVARYEGMEVFVESEQNYYQLIGGIANSNWVLLDNSGVSNWPYNPVDTIQTVYIALDGDDETGDGSESSPYLTTQRAVQHVQGNMFTGRGYPAFVYGPGTWNADEIFPYIRDIDNEFSNFFGIRIMGTPIIGDTINITHPGTSVQSYFRFNTDSTIVGDNSNQFIGRLLHPIYGAIGYPIVEHTSDSLIFPGNNYAVGDNRFFFTLGTKFQVSDSTSMRMDKGYFINVEFIQTDSLDSFDFTNSNFLTFSNCKFYGEYGSYDLVQLEGVAQSSFSSCIFDWTASSYTGDIIEASFGGHSWANCHFYSPNVYEIDPKGGQGIELRPNFNHAEIDMCSFKGIAECIKHDGGGFISLGGLYADSAEIVIHSFDPRIKIWGESDNNVWADGYDSIICKDVDYLCDFRDTYDAGNFVFLPHLKAGGYDQFAVSGPFENDVWDMENLSFITIGTGGIHTLKVDTVRTNNIIQEEWNVVSTQDSVYTIFIDPAGSDESGDGTRYNPVQTFKKASEIAPDYLLKGWSFWLPLVNYQLQFHFGEGTYNWSDIEPYLPDYHCALVGDTLDVIDSLNIVRVTDTAKYFIIEDPLIADDLYKRNRCLGGIIVSHVDDTLIATNTFSPLGWKHVYGPTKTIFNIDVGIMTVKDKSFSFIDFDSDPATPDLSFNNSERVLFQGCDFNIEESMWLYEADEFRFIACLFNQKDKIYTGEQFGLNMQASYHYNASGGSRNIDGVGYYAGETHVWAISGVFENFNDAILGDLGNSFVHDGDIFILDCDNGFRIHNYTPERGPLTLSGQVVMKDVTTAFDIPTTYPYHVIVEDFKYLDGSPTTISTVPINQYDLEADQYFFLNRDTAIRKNVLAENYAKLYPEDTIDMSQYPVTDRYGVTRLSPYHSAGTYYIDPVLGTYSYLNFNYDEFEIVDTTNRVFAINQDDLVLRTSDTAELYNVTVFDRNYNYVEKYKNDRVLMGDVESLFFFPDVGDTVKVGQAATASYLQMQTTDDARVDIEEANVLKLYAGMGSSSVIDSVNMLNITTHDGGYDPDSIGKYFAIKHTWHDGVEGDGLVGADETYFLYSEYGDNYLNGDLDVHGRFMDYPYGTYNMADYPIGLIGATNMNAVNSRNGIITINPETGVNNAVYHYSDTIILNDIDRLFYKSSETTNISGTAVAVPAFVAPHTKNVYLNDFTSPGDVRPYNFNSLLYPDDGDTIDIRRLRGGYFQLQSYTPYANNRVVLDEALVVALYSAWDTEVSVDSVQGLQIWNRDVGIPQDSIDSYYGIYHKDAGSGLRGNDKTYFLYSEYGDNWLNGDLDVHGRIIEHQPASINMSNYRWDDGPPIYNIYKERSGNTDVALEDGSFNYLNLFRDTITITSESDRLFGVDLDYITINSDVEMDNVVATNKTNYLSHENYINSNPLNSMNNMTVVYRLDPKANDTITIFNWENLSVQSQTYTPEATSRVDIGKQTILELFGSYDDQVSIDSVMVIHSYNTNGGIDPDSLGKYYVFYNEDHSGLRGADETYFLYSEYGDNYLNGDLYTVGKHERNISRTIDAADYFKPALNNKGAYDYNFGTLDVTPETNRQFWVEYTSDTLNLSATSNRILGREYKQMVVDTDIPITSNYVEGHSDNLFLQNLDAANAWILGGRKAVGLYPEVDDTISVKRVISQSVDVQTYTPSSTNRIDIGDAIGLYIYNTYDDYVQVDSIMGVFMELSNEGIPDDSIGSMYGIYNYDAGLRGDSVTYFAYSEYGDLFLGGGGEIDQYGGYITLGGDDNDWTARTDNTNKSGSVVTPHYDTDEEDVFLIGSSNISPFNSITIGGGAGYNAATNIFLYAADNTTTLGGTWVGTINTGGLDLLNGAELDQYGYNLLVGSTETAHTDRTDATTKSGAFHVPHYTNAEEELQVLAGRSTSTGNIVFIGGGRVGYNAATQIRFQAAATNTTLTGSNIATMDTSGLQLTNGSELDQYGEKVLIGGDDTDWTARTDNTTKTGRIIYPHYDTDEEDIQFVGFNSNPAQNTLFIGGGNANHNAVTRVNVYAAEDQITTTGTMVGQFEIDGFHVDTISELTSDNNVIIDDSLEVTGTITADQEVTGQRIMKVMEAQILYDNTSQTTIVTLPADAVIWDIQVEVRTAFTGTGTDLLDIGTTGTGNRYEDDLDVSTTGFKTISLTNVPDRMTGSTDITFQYTDQNSDAGAGEAYVYVHYSLH